jgi:3-oxoacyl-[acyl-carrier protein] reductase
MTDQANPSQGLLSGRVALVTGAAHPRGIGHAIALAFEREGATVVITDLPGATLDECDGIPCDVTQFHEAEAAVRQVVDSRGRLDILVNNAGVGVGSADFLDVSERDWQLSLDVNVRGIANMCRAAIPALRQQGGAIINVASLAGLGALESIPACYTASKFAAVGLTKALALQYAADAIRVNAICPGSVITQMHQQSLALVAEEHGVSIEEAQAIEDAQIPLGRSAQPGEIADAAVFLASNQASYVTGTALPVAGGMTAGL